MYYILRNCKQQQTFNHSEKNASNETFGLWDLYSIKFIVLFSKNDSASFVFNKNKLTQQSSTLHLDLLFLKSSNFKAKSL